MSVFILHVPLFRPFLTLTFPLLVPILKYFLKFFFPFFAFIYLYTSLPFALLTLMALAGLMIWDFSLSFLYLTVAVPALTIMGLSFLGTVVVPALFSDESSSFWTSSDFNLTVN